MSLHNKTDGRVLKAQMRVSAAPRTTISFYTYHRIDDAAAFRDRLYADLDALHVLGRIYVAQEGINAQISVPTEFVPAFRAYLDSYPFLTGLRLNMAIEDNGKSFFKLKILVRKKIVADGLDDSAFNPADTGVHVNAYQFNTLAADANTIIVDMRNHYESEVGYFRNAVRPDVDTFREELTIIETLMEQQRGKNLLMYCTGGIRCEKASAWMKYKGFSNVYQLEGGIIEYTRQVRQKGLENKFIGKNFVFDERLGERISDDIVAHCHQCGKLCDDHTNCRNDGCHLLFIQCAECAAKYHGCCSVECSDIIALPEDAQRELRRGINKGRQVFRKGRSNHLRADTTGSIHANNDHAG